ncbi:MAG: DUF2339 domain-containing protein, partial [Candidatus Omnitrophica bacterium]|nr:DUF2339 domain-containing protein [Candidatus Omnitrophota bacterium]
ASLCGYILAVNGFGKYVLALLTTGVAAHLLLTAWAYFRKERGTYIISSSFAIAFALGYASMKFTGYTLTVSYLVIAQIILLAGIVLKELFWRQLASILLACIFAKLIILDSYLSSYMMGGSPVPGKLFGGVNSRTVLFAIGFAMFMGNQFIYSYLYRKKTSDAMEDKWGVIFSYFYPAIFAVGTWLDLPKILAAPAWVILGVILLELGISKNNGHMRRQGYILTVGSFVRLLMSNFTVVGGISILSYRLLTVVPVLMVLYYCHMLLSEERGKGAVSDGEKNMHIFYSYLVFIGIMLLARFEVPADLVAPVWAVISGGYVIWAVISKERYYLPICSIGALAAAFRAGTVNIIQPGYLVGVDFNLGVAMLTAAVLYGGNVILLSYPESAANADELPGGLFKRFLRSGQFVHAFSATAVVTLIIVARTSGVLMTAALASEGLILFLAGFYVKEKNWRLFALGILLATLAKAFLVDLRKLETIYYILSLIILGVVLLFVSYMYNKYKDKIKKII